MGRLIAIGDIHGCLKTLRVLIEEKLKPAEEDTLIFLGDYIDRGPDSKGVIDYLIQLEKQNFRCVFLRGNHEQTLLNALDAERNMKKSFFSKPKNDVFISWRDGFGGKICLDSYGIQDLKSFLPDHEKWIRETVLYHTSDKEWFVHAGFNFEEKDMLSDTHAMLWIREFEYDANKAQGKKVVHGHVPVPLEFLQVCLSKSGLGYMPLDTGCVYRDRPGYGYLSAYDFTDCTHIFVRNCE
ncbi:MAG: serine/threonine protein phosphatase [Flavobacteriales bacterium]|nr:serine/threonine protein phosphatase [Flavobacteriales bacterium]